MRLEKWANLADIIGGLAIVATLIVVVIELRANTAAIEASNRQSVADRTQQWALTVVGNPELTALWAEMIERDPERQRFTTLLISQMKLTEESYLQYRDGHLDDEYWQTRRAIGLNALRSAASRETFRFLAGIGIFVGEFVDEMERGLDERDRE